MTFYTPDSDYAQSRPQDWEDRPFGKRISSELCLCCPSPSLVWRLLTLRSPIRSSCKLVTDQGLCMNRQQVAMKDEKRRKVETTSRYKRDVSESLIDDHSPTPHLSLSLSPVFSSMNHCRRPRPRRPRHARLENQRQHLQALCRGGHCSIGGQRLLEEAERPYRCASA